MTLEELRAEAESRGLKGWTGMRKAELEDFLAEDDEAKQQAKPKKAKREIPDTPLAVRAMTDGEGHVVLSVGHVEPSAEEPGWYEKQQITLDPERALDLKEQIDGAVAIARNEAVHVG